MPTTIEFNAAAWIAKNTDRGTYLTDAAQQAVANFTTMWNLFESIHCNNRASVRTFEAALKHYHPDQVAEATVEMFRTCLLFWQKRYYTPDGFSPLFNRLNFRQNDRKDVVEKVLANNVHDSQAEMLAVMIIIYRLRNNLFHGLKFIDMLNDQVENLTNASRCLAAIMEAIPSRFIHVQSQEADWYAQSPNRTV